MLRRIIWIFYIVAFFSDAVSESIISHFYVEDVDQLNTYPETVSYRPKMPVIIPMPQFFKCGRQETCTHVIWYERNQESKSVSDIDSVQLVGETVVVWKKGVQVPKEVKENPGGCVIPFQRLGCYNDVETDRSLPTMLISEKDPTHYLNNGHFFTWDLWHIDLPLMVCRCAVKTKSMFYTAFAIQNYGECWSGENGIQRYAQHGPAVGECMNVNYTACIEDDEICAGIERVNFVYKLT